MFCHSKKPKYFLTVQRHKTLANLVTCTIQVYYLDKLSPDGVFFEFYVEFRIGIRERIPTQIDSIPSSEDCCRKDRLRIRKHS